MLSRMDHNSQIVLQTLAQATSQVAAELKPAEQRLQMMETNVQGFYSILWTIFENRSLEVNVRWMALLYFKNGVDRHWRDRALPFDGHDGVAVISSEEKEKLRSRMLTSLDEPINQLAIQVSVVISKIARIDLPNQWTELLPNLVDLVKCSNGIVLQRAMLTLKHVVKAMASWRLPAHRRVFQEVANKLFAFVAEKWSIQVKQFLAALEASASGAPVMAEQEIAATLDLSMLGIKMLRQFVVHAFKDIGEVSEMPEFIQYLYSTMHHLLEARHLMIRVAPQSAMVETLEKETLLCTKVLLDLQQHKPLQFIPYIDSTLRFFCLNWLFRDDRQGYLFDRFIVQGLNYVKAVLSCGDYAPKRQRDSVSSPDRGSSDAAAEGYEVKMTFFTSTFPASDLCRQLVTNYFLLKEEELQDWEDNPEGFAYEEVGESWKFSLRPCVETVFKSLVTVFQGSLAPVLVDMIASVQKMALNDESTQLLREAVYNAVGIAAYELVDSVDFDAWFQQHLQQELLECTSRTVRRRIVWLFGQWIDVRFLKQLRPVLYTQLCQTLRPEEDLVVRLTAATSLQRVVDSYDFETETFLPYLQSSSELLFRLLRDAQECDTKMHVLHVFNIIIQLLGTEMRPHADGLLQYLPELWQQSVEHNMLRCAIVTALARLVRALGALCVNLYGLLIPIIAHCTNLNEPSHVYLLEDGLQLWHVTLTCSPTCTEELLKQFAVMKDLLDMSTENIKVSLQILESYLRLDCVTFLERYGPEVVSTLQGLLSDIRPEGAVIVFRCIQTIFKVHPAKAADLFSSLLFDVLSSVLRGERSGNAVSDSVTGGGLYSLSFEGGYMPLVMQYLALLARVLLQNLQVFISMLTFYGEHVNAKAEEVLMGLLDIWLEKFDSMPEAESRKLTALALCMLLPHFNWEPMRYASIIETIVDVLHQIHRCDEDGTVSDKLVYLPQMAEVESDDEDTEEDKRIRKDRLKDPVHTESLREVLRIQLNELEQRLTPVQIEHIMMSVCLETRQQLQAFLDA